MSDSALLRAVDFSVYAKDSHLLKDITFEMRSGDVYALVGRSGCGKTTLAYGLLRLLDNRRGFRTCGQVLFNGRDIYSMPAAELQSLRGRSVGFVFQDGAMALNPVLRVGDQVSETLRTHYGLSRKQARSRVLDLFARVSLEPAGSIYDHYSHQLSGGMRQRVQAALAICCDPELLIADEPVSALDATLKSELLTLLIDLCRDRNTSILLITHEIGLALRFASTMMIMDAGRLAEIGPSRQIGTSPRHPHSRRLLSAYSRLHLQNREGGPA